MRLRRLATAAIASALLGTGCAKSDPPINTPATFNPGVEDSPTASPEPTEGPATKEFRYPDGMIIRLVKVEKLNPKLASGMDKGRTLIRATATFTNRTGKALPLGDMNRYTTVYSGPNRLEGESETGYDDPDPAGRLDSTDPEQIVNGSTVTVFDTQSVPSNDLAVLTVAVSRPTADDRRVDFWFTDAQKLLKK